VSAPVRPDLRTERRSWEAYRAEFPVFERATYMNTCSLGALGARVRRAVDGFLDLWDERGASAWYGPWGQELDLLRASVARLLGAEAQEIALAPSVSAALAAVAGCFDYASRPRVVVAEIDFPTVAYQWLARAPQGAEVVFVRSPDGLGVPLEAYEEAIDDRTQLVATSHVFFQSGVAQDVGALARLAHARGARLLVDAYQGAGQLPLDVRGLDVDFLIAGGLKWLLGGPGIAYLYARGDLVPSLSPTVSGWFAHRRQFAFDVTHFELADGARRLEAGTPSVAAVYAARAGLEYVHEIGVDRIRARQIELLTALAGGLASCGLRPRLRGGVERHAGIVTVPVPDPPAAVAALAQDGVIIDSRPGVIRLSPYFYNTTADIEKTLAALRRHLDR
jgi:selenocysteine lyase/cysteine desulfurase